MKTAALILAALLALPLSAQAEWVRATDHYMFPPVMTEEEACQQAEQRARANAIQQVTGETFSSEETMLCKEQGDKAECDHNSAAWTMVGGIIRSIRNRRSETTQEIDAFRTCTVSFEADVYVAEGQADPNFDVSVTLNNMVYRDGENIVIALSPSQPMAVQVFQWLPYEKGKAQVRRLFPNASDNLLRIDKPITIPTEAGAKRYV